MANKRYIMGLFPSEAATVSTIEALGRSQWPVEEVYSPGPGHAISKALKQKKSKVGYFTLAGGILGFFTGFLLSDILDQDQGMRKILNIT